MGVWRMLSRKFWNLEARNFIFSILHEIFRQNSTWIKYCRDIFLTWYTQCINWHLSWHYYTWIYFWQNVTNFNLKICNVSRETVKSTLLYFSWLSLLFFIFLFYFFAKKVPLGSAIPERWSKQYHNHMTNPLAKSTAVQLAAPGQQRQIRNALRGQDLTGKYKQMHFSYFLHLLYG